MIFSLACKVYLRQPYGRIGAHLQAPLELSYITEIPSDNSLGQNMGERWLTPVLEQLIEWCARPMRIFDANGAIDSTPVYMPSYYLQWDKKKQRLVETHDFFRLHNLCGARTGIIITARVANKRVSEQKCFEPLVYAALAAGFNLKSIAGDKNYLSNKNMRLLAELGIEPLLTFKKNSRMGTNKSEVWNRLLVLHRSGDVAYKKRRNQRNMVETEHGAWKKRFDNKVMSINWVAQQNEALFKALCYNLAVLNRVEHRLGIVPKEGTNIFTLE